MKRRRNDGPQDSGLRIADVTGDSLLDILVSLWNEFHRGYCIVPQRGIAFLCHHGYRTFGPDIEWMIREAMDDDDDWCSDFDGAGLTGDDFLDLGVIGGMPTFRTLINLGGGYEFEEGNGYPDFLGREMVFADLNADGLTDLVQAGWSVVDVAMGDGKDHFLRVQELKEEIRGVITGEFEGHAGLGLVGRASTNADRLKVYPNITYLDPSGVPEEAGIADRGLEVIPKVVGSGACTIRLLSRGGGGREPAPEVVVTDVLGRRRALLNLTGGASGVWSATRHGTNEAGRRLPAGVYWIRSWEDEGTGQRVVLLR